MVLAFKLESTLIEHICHPVYLWLTLLDGFWSVEVKDRLERRACWEGLLEIDPPTQVVGGEQVFLCTLALHLVSIEVTTGHEHEFTSKETFFSEELVKPTHGVCEDNASVNLLLLDSSELGAEVSQLRVEFGFNIGVIDSVDGLLLDIDYDHGELDDLVEIQVFSPFFALALKVVDTNVVKGSLVHELVLLEVDHRSEVLSWDAAICQTLTQYDLVGGSEERDFVLSVHCFRHVQFNHYLAGGSHARDDSIFAGSSNGKMNVITSHSVETSFHDERHRLEIGAVDNRLVLEWVGDLFQQVFRLDHFHGVALNCANVHLAILFVQLESFLVIRIDNGL